MTADEWVDVVDADDHVIGTTTRPNLGDPGLNYRVVHVLLIDAADRLLLQRVAGPVQRGFTHGSSVAGHVQAGESYEAAAARETREELGVEPVLFPLGKTWIDEVAWRKFIGVFVGRCDGPFQLARDEVAALDPMPLAEVRSLVRKRSPAFSPTFHRVFRFADGEDAWSRP